VGEHVGYFSMDLGAGGYGASDGQGMVELGLSARGRYDLFEAGIAIDGATEVLGGSMTGVGAVAGLTTTGAPHFRANVLGEVGVHDYENLGGFLANGVSGSSAYLGGRVGAYALIGGESHFVLGVALFVHSDLYRRSATSAAGSGWFEGSTTRQIGSTHIGLVVSIGFDIAVKPSNEGSQPVEEARGPSGTVSRGTSPTRRTLSF
jgi:hypothetical protein